MGNFSYSNVPVIKHSRSRFDLSHGVKTSANVGSLYPFDVQEVYPGDTFKVKTSCVSRLTSQFLRPIMDNLFLDVYYFFVPSRLLYDKFKNVFGENTESKWANTKSYAVPTIGGGSASNVVKSGTVGDYLGLPINLYMGGGISVLPFRAFAKVYDDWFRDQNNISPMHIQTGEAAASEVFNENEWAPNNYTGKPPKVAKFHDYFTSCLPAPQKGQGVSVGVSSFTDVPVTTKAFDISQGLIGDHPLRLKVGAANMTAGYYPLGFSANGTMYGEAILDSKQGGSAFSNPYEVYPSNLWAKTSEMSAEPISVNDLRFAFQYQKMLERDARGGTRYVEYLQSHFGVSPGDYRLQRSEFLGGKRSPISVTQVTQTTGSDSETSPLGQVGAYSLSGSKSRYTKGFSEHGYVLGVFCIRQFHSYQQGIERFWKRSERTEFFDPVFSNIGEQPVYKYELYGSAGSLNAVFGYNEAWADLRTRQNKITGQMRTGATNSLDIWHLADNYANAPTLNEDFINETPSNLDRVITVESSSQDQFILDFYIQNVAYRCLPTYSVPSLIDHN
ncbi:major capsid protein [Microvirus mar8]|uniref:Major capsid protein n=1 Tax=Microvirus mar8 TaxID=2851204 RepID=A0A8F6AI33_9VIRU|nr:major capsid protein [Microvirus mar8]